MKKSLIALAIVGTFSAPAFADPTFYGLLDGAVASVSNTGQRSQTEVVSGGLATSRFGLKGSEDLGGGDKIIYQLEYALDIANNSTVGGPPTIANSTTTARQQLLGYSSSWGTVALGRLQTTGYDFENKFDPAAGSLVSPIQNLNTGKQFLIGTTAVAARANRALAYISPELSGFKIAVNYSTALTGLGNAGVASSGGATAVDSNTTAFLLGGYYDQGPVSVGLVYAKVGSPAANGAATVLGSTTNETEWALGGSYDFGVAKVLGTYASTKNDGANEPATAAGAAVGNNDKLWSLSGVIPAGPGAVALSYAKVTVGTDPTGSSDSSSYTGAYLYNFSKTATLYAAYSHVANGSGTNAYSVSNSVVAGAGVGGVAGSNNGASSGLFAIGLSKKF